jgi:hypothetical protein
LRQYYAGTRFEEQRQLHLPQKHKATEQDSSLRVEMNGLEEQTDNANLDILSGTVVPGIYLDNQVAVMALGGTIPNYCHKIFGGSKRETLELQDLVLLQVSWISDSAGGGIGHAYFCFTTAMLSF